MRKLLILLIFLCYIGSSFGQTWSFSPTAITSDFPRPGGGFERWNRQNDPYGTMHIPVDGTPQESMDYYERMSWNDFFANPANAGDSSFSETIFRQKAKLAYDRGQYFGFGIMSQCNNCDIGNNHLVNYNGGYNSYPKFLHDLMQGEATKDWFCTNGDQLQWIGNYNSPNYLRWVDKTCQFIRNLIDTGIMRNNSGGNPIPLRKFVKVYDIRFYGNYGEWHWEGVRNSGQDVRNTFPAGTFPTAESLDSIVSKQIRAFSGQLHFTIPFNSLDAMWLDNTRTPAEFGAWLIEHPDSVGFRFDHLSDDQGYDHDYWENNFRLGTNTTQRNNNNARIKNRWKYSMLRGEPPGYGGWPTNLSFLPTQVQNLHLNSFGNGNYGDINWGGYNNSSTTAANNARLAASLAGHKLRIASGQVTLSGNFAITHNWINTGVTPTYDHWLVQFILKNGSGTTVWTQNSNFQPRRFLPSASPVPQLDVYSIPAVPAGSYGLYVKVIDTAGYRIPYPLAQLGKQSDNSYFLTNITLTGGGGNQSPIANAGANQSLTLPTNSTTLNSTGSSDPDGSISSYAWSQISGPNTAVIASPSGSSTGISGMVAGTYVFSLTVTDNGGATATDQVNVTVNQAIPPVADAGPNKTITLPTTSTSVTGTGTDDIGISSYLWEKTAGPNTWNIVSPTSATTTINGLTTAGTYTFRLTVTDNSGLTHSDVMQVIVNPAPNNPPVANAGPNQTIVLPTSSVTVNGSASTDDNGIVLYEWLIVSGPTSFTIVSPNSVSTNITGLTEGIYTFRLRVTDGSGLVSIDDVQITVNVAPNTAPIAEAGPNQILTSPTSSTILDGSASSDPGGGIDNSTWSLVSGPSTPTIVSPNSLVTSVTGLSIGVYTFSLTVADVGLLLSTDQVTITVNAAANLPPIAEAGANQVITLPTSSITVNASSSTDDNGIVTYLWQQVSGPISATIVDANNVTTGITSMSTAGIYTFRVTVTDGQGLTHSDIMQVQVNPVPNASPVAVIVTSASSITLPTNSVTLNSTGSSDDVGISSYLFQQISGPNTATLGTPTGSSTTASNLIEGVYTFRLTIMDGGGLNDFDEVTVTVLPEPVVPPVFGGHSKFSNRVKFKPRAF